MQLTWQLWVLLGLGLAVLEIFTSTFYILWFGIAALVMGLLAWLVPGLPLTTLILAWVALASAIAAGWFLATRKRPSETRWSADELIGEVGLLCTPVAEFQKGRVRFQKPVLGAEEWPCTADVAIPAGERVRIVKVEGSAIRVARA